MKGALQNGWKIMHEKIAELTKYRGTLSALDETSKNYEC